MKYSIPASSYLLQSLKDYELNVTNSSRKTPKIPLPPSVTSRNSSGLTEEYESTSTDFDRFTAELLTRLLRIRYEGQKNRLYRITLWAGNVEDSERPSLESVLFMMNELDLSSSTPQVIDGPASQAAETETL